MHRPSLQTRKSSSISVRKNSLFPRFKFYLMTVKMQFLSALIRTFFSWFIIDSIDSKQSFSVLLLKALLFIMHLCDKFSACYHLQLVHLWKTLNWALAKWQKMSTENWLWKPRCHWQMLADCRLIKPGSRVQTALAVIWKAGISFTTLNSIMNISVMPFKFTTSSIYYKNISIRDILFIIYYGAVQNILPDSGWNVLNLICR